MVKMTQEQKIDGTDMFFMIGKDMFCNYCDNGYHDECVGSNDIENKEGKYRCDCDCICSYCANDNHEFGKHDWCQCCNHEEDED